MKKTKKQDAHKKRSSHKVRGVSPEVGRESTVENINKLEMWANAQRDGRLAEYR